MGTAKRGSPLGVGPRVCCHPGSISGERGKEFSRRTGTDTGARTGWRTQTHRGARGGYRGGAGSTAVRPQTRRCRTAAARADVAVRRYGIRGGFRTDQISRIFDSLGRSSGAMRISKGSRQRETCSSVSRPTESGKLVISLQSSSSSVSDDIAPSSAFQEPISMPTQTINPSETKLCAMERCCVRVGNILGLRPRLGAFVGDRTPINAPNQDKVQAAGHSITRWQGRQLIVAQGHALQKSQARDISRQHSKLVVG